MVLTQTSSLLQKRSSYRLCHPFLSPIGLSAILVSRLNMPLGGMLRMTPALGHHNMVIHAHTMWILSPVVSRQGFTEAIMAWVESPWDSSHLFLVPIIQQRSVGRVNKHVEFIGQFKEIYWGRTQSPLVPFVLYYLPPFIRSLKTYRKDGMDTSSKIRAPQWVLYQVEHLRRLLRIHPSWNVYHFCIFTKVRYELDGTLFTHSENQYHPECIKVGKPFRTRLVKSTLGLQ
jgi:hypothetical protein